MQYHVVSRQGKMYKYLIRGDSEGCVLIWNIPEVTNSQLAQIKQEDFAKPPGEFHSSGYWHRCSSLTVLLLASAQGLCCMELAKMKCYFSLL
jgi:hypothetical protein